MSRKTETELRNWYNFQVVKLQINGEKNHDKIAREVFELFGKEAYKFVNEEFN